MTITAAAATVTVTPGAAGPTSDSGATMSGQDSGGDSGGQTPDGPPVITGALTGPRHLTMSDVFEHENWSEGSVAVPRVADAQQGIFTTVSGCGGAVQMELRFADQSGFLVFTAAQGLNSESSQDVMEFQVSSDGKLVDTKLVKFNAQQKLQADLSGVTAVTIAVKAQSSDNSCGRANAVILGLSIMPKS
ncbi:hypothetical protein N865_00240 [Intrasporangium oryzae NRRL B-24470]|uniref:Glycosyl hydrolase family 98 putative carbohydrate-binding module domain-containing protein n=2 Tax=Intrasporangium TaxID=53357 RepID=W9GEA7_9MICO|nr:hypothetical protein N865_00240 [Intrasporangium oryzae NRRL B-24470]